MPVAQSALPAELIAAYHATHYRVDVENGTHITLRIGLASAALRALHAGRGVSCSAFLTAWDPGSLPASPEQNARAQAALLEDLHAAGLACLPGYGIEPNSDHPGEAHVLALGADRALVIALGQKYGQNAVLWMGEDGVPQLILLR